MAFDFGSLISGFSSGAATAIESRNKEIRSGAIKQLDGLVEDAQSREKTLLTERDGLSEQAKQLSTYVNGQGIGFTKSQILGLIQQPPVAKKLIEDLNKKKDLRDVDFSKIFNIKDGTEMDPEEYARRKTTPVSKLDPKAPTATVRGAFGFESPALEKVEQDFKTNTGKTASEVRAAAAGRIDMGEGFKPIKGTLDLSQFDTNFNKPEELSSIQNQLRDLIADGIKLTDPKAAPLLKKLQAAATLRDMFAVKKDKVIGDEEKPRTPAAINSIIDRSLRAALQPFIIDNVVRFDEKLNDYVPMTGDAESIKTFMDHKNAVIKNQAIAIGILDANNSIIGGRNSIDALQPYANIEKGKVTSFKSVGTAPVNEPPPPPANVNNAKPATISAKPIPVPANAIVNGKIDPTKMIAGQVYIAGDRTETWNGKSFLPQKK